jgi:hypothetical protein
MHLKLKKVGRWQVIYTVHRSTIVNPFLHKFSVTTPPVIANRRSAPLVEVKGKIAVGVGIAVPELLIRAVDTVPLIRPVSCCGDI